MILQLDIAEYESLNKKILDDLRSMRAKSEAKFRLLCNHAGVLSRFTQDYHEVCIVACVVRHGWA